MSLRSCPLIASGAGMRSAYMTVPWWGLMLLQEVRVLNNNEWTVHVFFALTTWF